MFIEYFRMDIAEEIKRIAESLITDQTQFIVDVIVSTKQGPRKVMVIVDADHAVSIDVCANLSRSLSNELEGVEWLEDAYTLEVSTPGVDHPLKLKRQYKKNVGRNLKVKFQERIEEGKLLEVTEEFISLQQETGTGKKKEEKTIDILFSEIEKAFVLVSFK